MKQSRDGFLGMLIAGFALGATVLFAFTAFVVFAFMGTWPPAVAVIPTIFVALLVGSSRFWRPDGINKSSGFLLGIAIGLAGAMMTCWGVLYASSHAGV